MKAPLTILFLVLTFLAHAQNAEVDKLKKDLAEANKRAEVAEAAANLAEASAIRAMDEVKKFQMEAERARMRAERAEAAASRARHICLAKLLAIKSLELVSDREQQSLITLLAYKFNTQYGGDPKDADIYKALNVALTSFNDPISKSQDQPTMAAALCKYMKRDLTKEEWTNFAGSDLKQEKVCGE